MSSEQCENPTVVRLSEDDPRFVIASEVATKYLAALRGIHKRLKNIIDVCAAGEGAALKGQANARMPFFDEAFHGLNLLSMALKLVSQGPATNNQPVDVSLAMQVASAALALVNQRTELSELAPLKVEALLDSLKRETGGK